MRMEIMTSTGFRGKYKNRRWAIKEPGKAKNGGMPHLAALGTPRKKGY